MDKGLRKIKNILKNIRNILNLLATDKKRTAISLKKKLAISFIETSRLMHSHRDFDKSYLFNKRIQIANPFWHLHSLDEIFIQKIYKFNSLNNKPYIIDCGANIGLSIIYFKKLYPNAEIIGFEPDKIIFQLLEENVLQFNSENITLENKAVWHENNILTFETNGSVGGKLNLDDDLNSSKHIKVNAIRLKDYLNRKVDFLKIDIEGAEFEVLKDIEERLLHVENIFIEYHSDPKLEQNLPHLLTILKNAGFRLYIKEAWNNLPFPFLHQNYKPFWDLQLNIFAYRNSHNHQL